MEQIYKDRIAALGYDHLVCDIFSDWEEAKDEILPQDRKNGSGNGTIHVFLGERQTASACVSALYPIWVICQMFFHCAPGFIRISS